MRIYNARVLIGDRFVFGGVEFDEKFLACGESVTDGDLDAEEAYLIPGLIDIHTHAAMGEDASDGSVEGLFVLSRYYARGGVTSWCPTTMTLKEPALTAAMTALRQFARPEGGAKIAGVHLEGPFLSYEKRGAQAAENLALPDPEMFARLNKTCGGMIRLITIAPELPGAMDFIREVSKVCTVSLGHSMADYDTAMMAYRAGASHTTHLFNAMRPLLHREPGIVGAAYDSGASAELICDGLHIHPSVIRIVFELFGKRTVLISDSLRCAGMPDGEYLLGGQAVTYHGGMAALKGTNTLAGSAIHLMDGVRKAVSFGIPLEKAAFAASTAPAEVIGRQDIIGSVAPGKCADFLLLDDALQIQAVYIDGHKAG